MIISLTRVRVPALPHFMLEDGRSVLDLFGKGFVLLAAEIGPQSTLSYSTYILPGNSAFASLYGLEPGGCVLVRPDGYVASRWRQSPPAGAIEQAMAKILNPDKA
ncbi:MAG: hypothetical protein WDN00_07080 [Limisphaerales bacterium]